jgi:hypothetical protein
MEIGVRKQVIVGLFPSPLRSHIGGEDTGEGETGGWRG